MSDIQDTTGSSAAPTNALAAQLLAALAEPGAVDAGAGARARAPHPFHHEALPALRGRLAELGVDPHDLSRPHVIDDQDPPCATRQLSAPRPFSAAASLVVRQIESGKETSAPALGDLACVLLAGGLLEVTDLERAAELVGGHVAECFGRAIVHRLAADGELEAAARAADHPRLARMPYIGWRALGDHHARRGETDAFLSHWSGYQTQKERRWIETARPLLVGAVARDRGWQDGLDVARRPRIATRGNRDELRLAALRPLAGATPEPELAALLRTEEELVDLPAADALALRVDAVLARAEDREKGADHPALRPLLEEITALDPTASKDLMRQRDALLLRLWPVIGTETTLQETRKAMRTPSLKREMTRLADSF
ncbi:hypothetical protein [Brachybacterium aquaticum]|uniref:Uncharacterized protein n=1 Tax=Brachybacterium aquaticum TaxID=1432564 RepID=A0A841A9R0_9MICO|nr:hypothetical protein [Brachybacterium aquaticum]MBB5830683.1 hypothetical protein [Brachybacterium aquaticum]